jgi:hypothetical protein
MERQTIAKNRKVLKKKMATVFSENIKTLSTDLQGVLLDDLVTAFENRLNVFNRIHQNTKFVTTMAECVEYETIKT